MSNEIWKQCVDFPMYEVSTKGRVRNIKTQRILKPSGGDNYHQYLLRRDGKSYNEYEHRLVAKAFVPNPNNCITVHHKDGKRNHNEPDNLEWIDLPPHLREYHSKRNVGKQWSWSPEAKAAISKKRKAYAQTPEGRARVEKWMSAMRIAKMNKKIQKENENEN